MMGPGDVCRHPIGVLHGLEAIEESVVEIKSPAPDIGAFFVMRKDDYPDESALAVRLPPSGQRVIS
jgi:hypothetical protein